MKEWCAMNDRDEEVLTRFRGFLEIRSLPDGFVSIEQAVSVACAIAEFAGVSFGELRVADINAFKKHLRQDFRAHGVNPRGNVTEMQRVVRQNGFREGFEQAVQLQKKHEWLAGAMLAIGYFLEFRKEMLR
jgi:hypothetical protein